MAVAKDGFAGEDHFRIALLLWREDDEALGACR